MVKKRVFYTCDICDGPYKDEELARDCEERGIEGIEIKPGLVLKDTYSKEPKKPTEYIIFIGEWLPMNHVRNYKTLTLKEKAPKLEESEREVTSVNIEAMLATTLSLIKEGLVEILEEEFISLKERIKTSKDFRLVIARKELAHIGFSNLDDLYREHSYFQKEHNLQTQSA